MFPIRLASQEDYPRIRDFYYDLIDAMADSPFSPGWTAFRLFEYPL